MSKEKMKSKSIVDVAEKAGVSISTASRALNDSERVKPSTKKQIKEVAARLGYELPERRPGPKPGSVSRKKKVAFIKFMDQAHYSMENPATHLSLKNGVMNSAAENGFSVQEYYLNTEAEFPRYIEKENFSGFLLVGAQPDDRMKSFLKTKPCCWLMNNPWRPNWGDHVMPDHREAGMMAAQYLLKKKAKHPAIVKMGAPERVTALRQEGFFYLLGKKKIEGMSITGEGLISGDPFPYPEPSFVEKFVERIKRLSPQPDSFFMDCDHSLATLFPVLVKEGLVIPGKTPLIGCNNQHLFLKGIEPRPATMEVHFEMIGLLGASQLAWRMKHQEHLQRVHALIAPTLVSIA